MNVIINGDGKRKKEELVQWNEWIRLIIIQEKASQDEPHEL